MAAKEICEIQVATGLSPAKGADGFDFEVVRPSGCPGGDLLIGDANGSSR